MFMYWHTVSVGDNSCLDNGIHKQSERRAKILFTLDRVSCNSNISSAGLYQLRDFVIFKMHSDSSYIYRQLHPVKIFTV
jgi:hypothetical protein